MLMEFVKIEKERETERFVWVNEWVMICVWEGGKEIKRNPISRKQ